ncbi:MAG: hypothetical protein R3B09_24725 [Nannocystaceae bacterium]
MVGGSTNHHDAILEALLGLSNAESVYLVARGVFGSVSFPRDRAAVFVPDLHLMSAATARLYRFSFHHDQDGPILREPLMAELCRALAEIRAARTLDVYQLGDMVDLWREARIGRLPDATATTEAILLDNPATREWLATPMKLGVEMVIGNHERVGGGWSLTQVPQYRDVKVALALGGGDVVVTHGDVLDDVQDVLSDRVNKFLARTYGQRMRALSRDVRPALRLRRPADVPARHGIRGGHELLERATAWAQELRRGDPRALRTTQLDAAPSVSVFVIGHTHRARLVVSDQLILMDCGAWSDLCRLEDRRIVPACQLGVIACNAQGAADLRIYQLTPYRRPKRRGRTVQ